MTSHLSSATIQQLTPFLARWVAEANDALPSEGSQLSDEVELNRLLIGTDLDSEPAVLEELRHWQWLLMMLRQEPSQILRQVMVETLRMRGLPEAPVILAVAMVAEAAPPPLLRLPRLAASVERLDFGTLFLGDQPPAMEFELQRGAERVQVQNRCSQIRMASQEVGHQKMRYRVEVTPPPDGLGLLWSTLKLDTASESLRIPVVAQWLEPPSPLTIMIAPDESGDFRTLAEALPEAPPDATLLLAAATYHIEHPLKIDKPLTIVGAGMESTILTGECADFLLAFVGTGICTLNDLTLRREGEAIGDVVQCSRGELLMSHCRVK